jgi:glycine dehydrogenase
MTDPSLDLYSQIDTFADRHVGPSAPEIGAMLAALGVADIDQLLDEVVPTAIRVRDGLALPEGQSEIDAIASLRILADKNRPRTSLIGMGYHGTVTPPVIQRNILENPAWYTAYTPYQPEISQGRLEALLNFQTLISDLTAMDLANASLLDEGTAVAEAMTMSRRLSRAQGQLFLVDADCHPQTLAVVATRAAPLGLEVRLVSDLADIETNIANAFGVLLQQPSSTGALRDISAVAQLTAKAGAMLVVAADLLSLVLIEPPGRQGADIVVGSSQRFGVPLGFGGPHAAYIATRTAHARALPGRLVGVSIDDAGHSALRLALQTREQHIRRDKATSNICTAQVLLAVMAGMYAVYHGPDGLRRIARRVHRLTSIAAAGLAGGGCELVHESWFDTVAVRVPGQAETIVASAAELGYDVRLVDVDTISFSFDETSRAADVEALWAAFGVEASVAQLDESAANGIGADMLRVGEPLPHPVFSRYQSEHEMLRYLRRLSDMDLALDRTMIPLGSCTMKLNATSEMIPITWPEFASVHPFAPADETVGYVEMIRQLEAMLVEVTGYDAVSLQPNAGSQGELAGLLAIRSFHLDNREPQRDVCLIPASAHGTNAASAVMAGMRVVVVACDERGNVDLGDLTEKAATHARDLAACMVTYPSTHGVFEAGIVALCEIVHRYGGQVYLDGANLNAMVGLAKPGLFGADVSHLNLHKTFCIPHGGGGPGVGPVAVKAHLAPYLPNHPQRADAGPASGPGPISAAPFGSAGILPISWMYVTMMGAEGLRRATATAILSANYLASRLGEHFPVLYRGANDRVAHECILDLRPLTKATGVTVDDVAKRLIDHGFHAPTVSFPVSGTLMIEPTESESKRELDRFCEAMIAIRAEVAEIEAGLVSIEDTALRHSPHTAAAVTADVWDRAYTRSQGAFPGGADTNKYWPPVGRVDAAAGDRNLMCSCPPMEELATL